MKIKYILCLVCLMIITSCSNGSGHKTLVIADGTSDTGGGNGIENAAYEAYIIKPESLPAYKNYLQPKIEKLIQLTAGHGTSNNQKSALLKKWLLYKTWYLAPVELTTISKEIIGVSFSEDKTEQLAIQTRKSVWLDSRKFNQMSQANQATLILHEMIMSLYYLKYKSWKEVCDEKLLGSQQCTQKDIDVLSELFPGTDPQPFSSTDYENIRAVTGAFLIKDDFSTIQDVDQLLISNHFDRRFTATMGLGGDNTQQFTFTFSNLEMDYSEIDNYINAAHLVNKNPDTCLRLTTNQSVDCKLALTNTLEKDNNGIVIPYSIYTVVSQSIELNDFSFKELNFTGRKAHGSVVGFPSFQKEIIFFPISPAPSPTAPIPGTQFKSGLLVLLRDLSIIGNPTTFLGIISIPGVILKTDPTSAAGCIYTKPSPTNFNDDVLLTYSKSLTPEELGYLRFRAKSYPVFTSCR